MKLLSRYKVFIWVFFAIIFIGGLSTSKLISYAAGSSPKFLQGTSLSSRKPTSNCGTWSAISSPNPGNTDELNGVVSISTKDVWAVGEYNSNNVEQTLIEHWDGVSWSVVPSPNVASENSRLYGVTAISANNIWAVGSSSSSNSEQPLIEHWDGSNWNIISSPDSGSSYGRLDGITSISSGNIWAVGYDTNLSNFEQTLIEHWNGKKWGIVASPNFSGSQNNFLTGVVRSPGSNQVWAVGSYNTSTASGLTLIEHWNGGSWSLVSSPNPGSTSNFVFNTLSGIAAASANNIWAVGSYYNVNGYQPLIEHWDGSSWNSVSSPNPGTGQIELATVTKVPGTSQVWAAGFYSNTGNPPQTLTEFYC